MVHWNTELVDMVKKQKLAETSLLNSNPFWKNNLNIMKPNLLWDYTEEEIYTIVKCKKDILEFVKVLGIELMEYQHKLLVDFSEGRFHCVKYSRQVGVMLPLCIFILYEIVFKIDHTILLVCGKKSLAFEKISKIKELYESLPFYIKSGVKTYNDYSISFDNNSNLIAGSISPEFGIGFSVNSYIMTDMGSTTTKIIEDFYNSSYPITTAIKNSKFIMVSNNSYNSFFNMIHSNESNNYKKHTLHYSLYPNRGDDWKQEIISNFGKELFDEQYDMVDIDEFNDKKKINIQKIKELMFEYSLTMDDLK